MHVYIEDLGLNNLQWLIYPKTKPNYQYNSPTCYSSSVSTIKKPYQQGLEYTNCIPYKERGGVLVV